MFYIVVGVWGIAQGAHIANLLSVMYDFCGSDRLTLLLSLELMMEGIGGIVGAPMLGNDYCFHTAWTLSVFGLDKCGIITLFVADGFLLRLYTLT